MAVSRFSNLETEEGALYGNEPAAVGDVPDREAAIGFGIPEQDANSLLITAAAHELNGEFEKALRNYSAAVGENPLLPAAWVGQTWALIQLEEYPEASVWCDKALESFPESQDLIAVKAVAEYRMGNESDARVLSDRALELRGESPLVWLARGEIMLSEARAASDECFGRAMRGDNREGTAGVRVAGILVKYGRHASTLPLLRRVVADTPSSAYAWYLYGITLTKLGQRTEALEALGQACELCPGNERYVLARTKAGRRSFSLLGLVRRLFGRK